jgi:hypothetical protein
MGGRVYDDPAAAPSERVPGDPGPRAPTTVPAAHANHEPIDARSVDPRICPFLRAIDDQDRLDPPLEVPHPLNRCAALSQPVPQSLRQQELVCLSSAHVNCPRYLRGQVGTGTGTVPMRLRGQTSVHVTPATVGALAVLVLAFATSVAFVVANGGIALTTAAVTPAPSGGVLGAVETGPPSMEPTSAPLASATPSPTPLPTASPAPTPSPAPSPTPAASPTGTPAPTAAPTAKATPRPTSGRFALLTPCPNRSDCWLYRIRRGDNLYSIANYFGVSLSTVRAWNPWVEDGLVIGRSLRIPTPTR